MAPEQTKNENSWPYLPVFFSQEAVLSSWDKLLWNYVQNRWFINLISLGNCSFILTNRENPKYVSISNVLPSQSLVLYCLTVRSDFVDRRTLGKRYLRCAWCHLVRTSDKTVDHCWTVNYRTKKLHLPRFLVS